MATEDRIYFARRAAEEQELALTAGDPQVAETHRRLQRAYLERASVGERVKMPLPPQAVG
jgi:diphthamide biosynthesis methyltransferase